MNIKKISLHPRLAAVIFFVLSAGMLSMLSWITRFHTPTFLFVWFSVGTGLMAALIYGVVYYPPAVSRLHHLVSLAIFMIGMLGFFMFVEWRVAWYILGVVFMLVPASSFWLIPKGPSTLSFTIKPLRRWCFLMTAVGMAGFWTALNALFTFQILTFSQFWLLGVGALFGSFVAGWWWSVYGTKRQPRFWISLAVLALVILEFLLVVIIWPLGYLVNGLLLTWVWYILMLLLRFYNSVEGLAWKKQKFFLFINAGLLITYLVVLARWR